MAETSNIDNSCSLRDSFKRANDEQSDTADNKNTVQAMEPLLVHESSYSELPPNLLRLIRNLKNYDGSSSNRFELLGCLFYILMIEDGFVPCGYESIDCYFQRLAFFNFLPERWKRDHFYYFKFYLERFHEQVVTMVVNRMENLSVVNVYTDSSTFTISLDTSQFITNEIWEHIPAKFKNLKKLSQDFKNKLSNPLKNRIMLENQVIPPNLDSLPTELLEDILKRTSVKDRNALKLVSSRLYKIVGNIQLNKKLWK